MAKPQYLNLADYRFILEDMIRQKKSFLTQETSYTKKIKYGDTTMIFNQEGEGDFNGLHLINLVRRDAQRFLETYKIKEESHPRFFELTEKPPETVITKVDVRAAYWSYALQEKIISKATDDYLNEHYDSSEKLKKARLRALGSLATKKIINEYINGELKEVSCKEENTRDLYLHICKGIDLIMMEMAYTIPGAFYYYWDCIFSSEDATAQVRKFIEDAKYHHTVKTSRVELIDIGEHKFLFTKDDEKMYLIKKEQHLLCGNQA